jgi:hypothetical protein
MRVVGIAGLVFAVEPAPKVQIIALVISSCRARERLFSPALG